ncbi:MAG: PilN domain-containing protein, partial [Synergistota bacterium]|nr:PilN domain-containing protein [Synergistota bacterium]
VLEKALPPSVWLGEMSVSGNGVALSGTAYSENDVVSFARAMTEAPVVASVGFPVTSRVRSGNGGAVRFTLDCVLSDLSAPVQGQDDAGKGGTGQ